MLKQRKFWSWLVVLSIVFSAQLLFMGGAIAAVTDYNNEQKFLTNVWQLVNRSYVDSSFNHQNWYKVRRKFANRKFNSRDETYTAIQEMLATLDDPFTRLLRPDQFRSMQTSTAGELTGVGLQIAVDTASHSIIVVAPIEGSPADRAGVRSLDRIVKIDNASTENMTLDECAERMRGSLGSKVTLTIARPVSTQLVSQAPDLKDTKNSLNNKVDTLEVTIQRDRIAVNPVIAKLNQEEEHKVGYIRLSQFNGNAATDMSKAIKQLEAKGADRYVLDLRGNPGGLFDAGLEIARMWLPEGVIVFTRDRQGLQESYAATNAALTGDPLVILTDGGTASASEVLAGALQENGRAALLGTRTFGKGLIQSLYDLDDGSGLAVTIAKYETPKHHDIHKKGITPDVEVKLTEPLTREKLGTKDDGQYVAALQLLSSKVGMSQTSEVKG
ncbi:S41 family peptidase [Tumidithrix helvetica PCC 7403]|uniref:S41 family peptidase n=1 Tax=Tumidithrix helvetica TaxID=3457545 RepID=UPI003C866146